MKITIMSDTHNKHLTFPPLPAGDLLIHTGDATGMGSWWEIRTFLDWLELQPFTDKVLIAGNHDFHFENNPDECIKYIEESCPSVTYLQNSGAEIQGLKFWGSADCPAFMNWAFNRTSEQLEKTWAEIPKGLDFLLTHTPPLGVMDKLNSGEDVGCPALLAAVKKAKPKYNCFGHIHEQRGQLKKYGINFINSALLNDQYRLVNEPIVLEI